MNTLSIFIYAADVLPNYSNYLFSVGLIIFIAAFGYNFIAAVHNSDVYDSKNKVKYKFYIVGPILAFIVVAISLVIPSKIALLSIAASEIGEEVVKTPQVSSLLNDTLALVQKKLKDELAKEEKGNESNSRK